MQPVDDGIFPSTFYKTINALLSDCKRNERGDRICLWWSELQIPRLPQDFL
jgi:hypothetical protein